MLSSDSMSAPWLQWTHKGREQSRPFTLRWIKEGHGALRKSLFQPVTELAHGWGKALRGAFFSVFLENQTKGS